MKEVAITNDEVLTLLDEALWFYEKRDELKAVNPQSIDQNKDYYLSEDYLKKIKDIGSGHIGFPEAQRSYELRPLSQSKVRSKQIPSHWLTKYLSINDKLMNALSVRHNALAAVYPPNGFISWHNNANATGFNLILTWSETGEGWFDYIDPNGKRVSFKDKPNQWVCRYGIFGSYHQTKYPIVYHAASTDCWRMTLSYIFDESEISCGMQEFIIEELTTP